VMDEAVMGWFRIPRDDLVLQVLHYRDVETAKRSFHASPPEKVSPDVFSGASEYPIGADLSAADETRFICGQWTGNLCRTW
ncbi:hypothetical protein, partial [Streptomyces sp. MAR4 CNX-425]|uniref:hypothetical protein n=1 Tax=Streptomyces sp. MAR4 CNX-425 TaxID=3406343 RepID=UPI003B506F3B